ncbi:MAG: phosphoserine phosphatase SerB [Halobacteriales archaeon]|nr:phosphoserine phosphatase SerB [Halobacteriales archaeon]
MPKLLALSVLGLDRPGLIAEVSGAVSKAGGNIVHVEQNSVRGMFTMFMLVEPAAGKGKALPKLRAEADRALAGIGLNVRLAAVDSSEAADRDLHAIVILGADKPGVMHAITACIAEHGGNIERMRHVAKGDFMAFEITMSLPDRTMPKLRRALRQACEALGVDAVVQPESLYRARRRLVVFDMDSTIVDGEVIDELAKAAGVEEHVSRLTARAMRGEVDFKQALRERVGLLHGLPVRELERIARGLRLTPGSADVVSTLKRMGFKVALLSGGFTFFTDRLQEELGFDYAFANELEVRDGKLTGRVQGPIVDAKRKAAIVRELCRREGLSPDEVVAVGDGANDRIMVRNAGLGIAFNAKDVLKRVADGSITEKNLRGLLYAMGATQRDLKR